MRLICACGLLVMLSSAVIQAEPAPQFILKWGSQGSLAGQFQNPAGMATDPWGNVFVADWGNHCIKKFDGQGNILNVMDAPSGVWPFNVSSVATDEAGNCWVVNRTDGFVYKFSSAGSFMQSWPAKNLVPNQSHPVALAVGPGNLIYLLDQAASKVLKCGSDGSLISSWGSIGSAQGEMDQPFGITTDAAGNVIVADSNNHRIVKFTSEGVTTGTWGSAGSAPGQFLYPINPCTDNAGNIYVADSGNNRIEKFTPDGGLLTLWGTFGTGDGQFDDPAGVCVGPDGAVYVADYNNNRVEKFGDAATTTKTTSWGNLKSRYR